MSNERFLTLTDVADILNISSSQAYALVQRGELPAIQVGGRAIWRVERTVLEDYIQAAYRRSAANVVRDDVGASDLTANAAEDGSPVNQPAATSPARSRRTESSAPS